VYLSFTRTVSEEITIKLLNIFFKRIRLLNSLYAVLQLAVECVIVKQPAFIFLRQGLTVFVLVKQKGLW